jgi:hypothetical protein
VSALEKTKDIVVQETIADVVKVHNKQRLSSDT